MMNGRSLRPSAVDRFLRLFTDIRSGESVTALLLMVNIFLILTAYQVMKVVREPLIRAGGGAEVASYAAAGQAVVLLGLVPLYGAIAARFPRRKLINTVTAFFVACLAGFYLLARLAVPVGVVFYVWVGIFSVMVIAQFWSFANDVYTTDEGKRLFPIVAFGGSAGAVFGAWLPGQLAVSVGVYQLLLVAAGILVAATVLTNIADARERRRTEAHLPDINTTGTMPAATGQYRAQTGEFRIPHEEYRRESGAFKVVEQHGEVTPVEEPPISKAGAFRLVFRNRYLLLIAFLILLLNWVNTNGEFILRNTVFEAAEQAAAAGTAGGRSADQIVAQFYSGFGAVVNLAAMLIQLFAVSRIIKYLGIRTAILVLPAISFAAYGLMAFVPVLAAIRWAKTAENATDYSLQNTARQALFLPTTREEKYSAKQAIDSFFQRAGDVMSALLVFVGTNIIVLQTREFALVNMVLVVGWITLAVFVGRRYNRLAAVAQQ
jgi:AAA family ATP:ADP antiporter